MALVGGQAAPAPSAVSAQACGAHTRAPDGGLRPGVQSTPRRRQTAGAPQRGHAELANGLDIKAAIGVFFQVGLFPHTDTPLRFG